MESPRQRGLTAGERHKVARHTYDSLEESKETRRTTFHFQTTRTEIRTQDTPDLKSTFHDANCLVCKEGHTRRLSCAVTVATLPSA